MAIAHENQTSSSTTYGVTLTWAHTTSGSDKILIVSVGIRSATITINSVTHNGNSLTRLRQETGNFNTGDLWYMVNPDATGNVIATISEAENIVCVANSYTGIHQTSPFGTDTGLNSGSGLTSTLNLSSAVGELCIDALIIRSGDTPTITGGQTLRGAIATSAVSIAMSEEAGAASVDMSWSWSSGQHSQLAVPLKPVATGGGATGKSNPLSGPLGGSLSGPLG